MLGLFFPQYCINTASTATGSDSAKKGKAFPLHAKQAQRKGTPPPYSTPVLEEGQRHAPAAAPPGKRPGF